MEAASSAFGAYFRHRTDREWYHSYLFILETAVAWLPAGWFYFPAVGT